MHPYISLTTEYVTVSVPEAIEYTITFNTLTKTELFQDTVTFCSDTSCAVIYGQKSGYSGLTGTSWPGVDGSSQLVISASSFVVRFATNGTYGVMWREEAYITFLCFFLLLIHRSILILIYSYIYIFTYSLIQLFIYLLIYLFIYLLIYLPINLSTLLLTSL